MAIEQYSNGAATTLSGGINNSVTSLTVASASGFPNAGNFRILIGTELLLVTAVTGTTWTVTRGVEGTTAASHSSGDTVTHILTAQALKNLLAEGFVMDTYANLPSAGRAGRHYIPSDGNGLALHDNGTTWDGYGPVFPMTRPDINNFTWVNQGSSTANQTYGGISVVCANSSSENYRLLKKSKTGSYTVTACFRGNLMQLNYMMFGLAWRESSSGKIVSVGPAAFTSYSGGSIAYSIRKMTNATTFSAAGGDKYTVPRETWWIRIRDDGTNRYGDVSHDSSTWLNIYSESRTTFLTADEVGFFGQSLNTTYDTHFTLLSWKEA